MIKIILQIIQTFFGGSQESAQPSAPPVPAPPAPKPTETEEGVDWSNPKAPISKYFTVHNATYLPSWRTYHMPSPQEKENILKVAKKMDVIREFLGEPINVHVWMRPGVASCPGTPWDGKDYNRYIYETQVWKALSEEEKAKKQVPNSPHKSGEAVDWSVVNKKTAEACAEVREKLLPKLEEWGVRMEDIHGSWVHIDTKPVISKRFFKP